MATILGGLTTSHIPLIGKAIAQDLRKDPYWQPFFSGFPPAHDWLAKAKPDVAVVVYNDHGLNFFLDKLPTFAVGAAPEMPDTSCIAAPEALPTHTATVKRRE